MIEITVADYASFKTLGQHLNAADTQAFYAVPGGTNVAFTVSLTKSVLVVWNCGGTDPTSTTFLTDFSFGGVAPSRINSVPAFVVG